MVFQELSLEEKVAVFHFGTVLEIKDIVAIRLNTATL